MPESFAFDDHDKQQVEFFIGGRSMMASLAEAMTAATKSIYIAGWRLNPFQKLRPDHADAAIRNETLKALLSARADVGVAVRVLIWDSPGLGVDTGDEEVVEWLRGIRNVEAVADEVGYTLTNSHHQKFVLIDDQVAFLGGIDIAGGRWDESPYDLFPGAGNPRLSDFQSVFVDEDGDIGDAAYRHDALGIYDFTPRFQRDPSYVIPPKYGTRAPRLPWHDVHARIRGSVVKDISAIFCGRWNKLNGWFSSLGRTKSTLHVDAGKVEVPSGAVARVRMVLSIDRSSIPLESSPVRSYQEAYRDLIRNAKRSIYIENQYFISQNVAGYRHEVIESLIRRVKRAMAQGENLSVIVVLPVHPDGDPNDKTTREHYYWQEKTIRELREALGAQVDDYVGFFSPGRWEEYRGDSHRVAQIYVHSKLLIADGGKALIGSANINARSLTGSLDTEIGLLIDDEVRVASFQNDLVATHLGSPVSGTDLLAAFRQAAAQPPARRRVWRHPIEDQEVWGLLAPPFEADTRGLFDWLFLLRPEEYDDAAADSEDRHGLSLPVDASPIEELRLVEEASFPRRRFTEEQVEKTLGLAQAVPSLYPHRAAFLALEERFAYVFQHGESWGSLRRIKKYFYEVTDLISQRHFGVLTREIAAADTLCRSLYERIESSADADRVLTYFGRGGPDYYRVRPQKEDDLPVFVCLPTGAVNCVWKWTALGHEMGHQVLHDHPELDSELTELLDENRAAFEIPAVLDRALDWTHELFGDLLGLAQFGPASALNLYSIERHDGRVLIGDGDHPPLLLRARLAERILRLWDLSRHSLGELPALPPFREVKIEGRVRGRGRRVSRSKLERDLKRLAKVMVQAWGEIPTWTQRDQQSVAILKRKLKSGYKPASPRRPPTLLDQHEERHLVAACRMLLHDVARQGRYPSHDLLEYLHRRIVHELAGEL